MSSAVKLKIPISKKRKHSHSLCLFHPLHTSPLHYPVLCPLTFITHFLFMLGRNCGCSWWFEVRRDWPWVTLNKYTRTSQEGAGRLHLPPNHPWLISWLFQGDFLCTLPTTTIPSPNQPPPPPKHIKGEGIMVAPVVLLTDYSNLWFLTKVTDSQTYNCSGGRTHGLFSYTLEKAKQRKTALLLCRWWMYLTFHIHCITQVQVLHAFLDLRRIILLQCSYITIAALQTQLGKNLHLIFDLKHHHKQNFTRSRL